jgi:cytochrome bd-type quinol oxidase subunit 2
MRTSQAWAVGSLVLAVVASAVFLVVPTYEGACIGVAEYGPDGTRCPTGVGHTTLLEENGPHVLWVLAVPVVLAAIGTLLRRRGVRAAVAIALAVFSLLSSLSIGAAYLPAVVAMAIAARKSRDDHERRQPD